MDDKFLCLKLAPLALAGVLTYQTITDPGALHIHTDVPNAPPSALPTSTFAASGAFLRDIVIVGPYASLKLTGHPPALPEGFACTPYSTPDPGQRAGRSSTIFDAKWNIFE